MLQRIGRYEILEEIGRGAMGIVYKARDPIIGRFVAIKTVRLGDFSAAPQIGELKTRLVREAQSAGSLSHANIITIFDVGEEDGLSYIAMELVEGLSLEALLESKQALAESTILHVARQVADALGYAHQRGIVHRDIKPANIMLTQDGRVKVADFGIAKIGSAKMTQTGVLLGSPSYMAPEHFLGQALDGRSDIFALGIVLYELITGQTPFVGENLGTLSYKIVNEDVLPPNRLKPALSPEFNDLIMKALARDPGQRFQNAAELCATLDGISGKSALASTTIPALGNRELATDRARGIEKLFAGTYVLTPPARKSPFRWLLAPFLALLIAALGALVFAFILPEQFQQFVHVARTRAQPWLDKLADKSSSLPTPNTHQSGEGSKRDAPTSYSEGKPVGRAEEPIQKVTEPKGDATPLQTQDQREPAIVSNARVHPEQTKSAATQKDIPLGTIQVSSTPPGAQIVFDDKEEESWLTPYTFREIAAGRHTLDIKKVGFNTERRIVILFGTETQRINVVLVQASGILQVTTAPSGAQIYVDGELKSELSPATLRLPAGARRVLLRKEGFRDVEQLIEIEDNSVTTLNQQLLQLTP